MLIEHRKIPRVLWLMIVLMLAACGQKGPLVMPDKPDADTTETNSTTGDSLFTDSERQDAQE